MTKILTYEAGNLVQVYGSLFESVVFGTGKVLYGINIDSRPEGCRIILKTFTKGKPEICFINASTFERCCELIDTFCNTTSDIGVKWYPDKYYKPTEELS